MQTTAEAGLARWFPFWGGLIFSLGVSHLLFGEFFPGPNGLGHDYSGGLPGLLSEYYWSLREGPWEPMWFNPAFCGGIPGFADPGSGFYSFPSLLVRLFPVGPTDAFYLTLLVFSGLGYVGMFLFARALGMSAWAAVLTGVLFSLNGFHVSRMLVGHTGFHGFMLAPWLAFAVTRGLSSDFRTALPTLAGAALIGGLTFAYWVHSGAASLLLPLLLTVLALVLVALLRGVSLASVAILGCTSAVVGIGLSASKLVAGFAYLGNFPRADYRLPGFSSFFDAIQFGLLSLFVSPTDIAPWVASRLSNIQWALDRHELENGVTWVPVVLLALAFGAWVSRRASDDENKPNQVAEVRWRISPLHLAYLMVLLFILILPLAINTYGESWNSFLKTVPLIGSSSSLVRWYFIYIPMVILATGFALDYLSGKASMRRGIALLSVAAVALVTAQVDRGFYRDQSYDPKTVESAFLAARNNPFFAPRIEYVGAFVDGAGQIQLTGNRNDLLVQNISQLACYVPIFGYRLEYFPFKSLRTGPSMEVVDGVLNVKNPACFVYPDENSCKPGDHFTAVDADRAQRFLSYKSIPFERSGRQTVADLVTIGTVLLLPILLLIFLMRFVWVRRQ
jgi:hypothetical protein